MNDKTKSRLDRVLYVWAGVPIWIAEIGGTMVKTSAKLMDRSIEHQSHILAKRVKRLERRQSR